VVTTTQHEVEADQGTCQRMAARLLAGAIAAPEPPWQHDQVPGK